jgi:hypothetical protein
MEVKLSSASTISEADLATAVPETNHRLNNMVKMRCRQCNYRGYKGSKLGKKCSNRLIFHTFWLVICKRMRIRILFIILMWIRIQLITLMRIRSLPFNLMRIYADPDP